jgi:hypothetical protein
MKNGNENAAGDGAQNNDVQISPNMEVLVESLKGLNGAEQILRETGKEAVEKGIIKVGDGNNQSDDNSSNEDQSDDGNKSGKGKGGKEKGQQNNNSGNEEENEEEENEEENEEEEDDENDNNPLLKTVKGKKGNKKTEVVFENFDQIKAHSKKALGIEVKTEKDFNKVFSSALKWREDAQELPAVKEKLEKMENVFNEMPAPLLDSIKAFFEGDSDWDKHVVSKPKFDFTKSADKQDKKALVNHYYPNKFTDADWAEETPPQALEIAIQSSQTQYNVDKRDIEKDSADRVEKSKLRIAAVKTSIDSSLTTLKSSFPDLDAKGIKEISKVLESGDINSLFFDKNGAYKTDAAERVLLALYGKETIKSMMKVSAKRAESATNEDILSRGANKPRAQKGGGSQKGVVDEKTKKAIDVLVGGLNKNKTY